MKILFGSLKMSKVNGKGKRFNKGKVKLDLVPNSALYAMALVFEEGAKKYDEHNWRNGMKWSTPYASMMRHLTSFWDGEEIDPETGLSHLYHAACNIAMLIEYQDICPELDDRYKGAIRKKENMKIKSPESINIIDKDIKDRVILELRESDLNNMADEYYRRNESSDL
jgi:hypothetical protein